VRLEFAQNVTVFPARSSANKSVSVPTFEDIASELEERSSADAKAGAAIKTYKPPRANKGRPAPNSLEARFGIGEYCFI